MSDFKSIFSYDSKLMTILNNLADLMFVNLLFILCCIPVVTIGAARSALHSVAAQWMNKDHAGGREFMKAFWENLRYATLPWLVMLVIGAVLVWEAVLLNTYTIPAQGLVWAFFYLMAFVYLLTLTHVFHIPARFNSTMGQSLKSALLLGLGNLVPTVFCAALGTIPFIILFKVTHLFLEMGLIWIFAFFSIEAAAEAWAMKKTYARLRARFGGEPEEVPEAEGEEVME